MFCAALPWPPFTNSAVDGYAVFLFSAAICRNKRAGTPLYRARSRPDAAAAARLESGEGRADSRRAMTEGGNRLHAEEVRLDGRVAFILPAGLEAGANVRRTADHHARPPAMKAGQRLRPQDCRALPPPLTLTQLDVVRRISVAVSRPATEMVSPGTRARGRRNCSTFPTVFHDDGDDAARPRMAKKCSISAPER